MALLNKEYDPIAVAQYIREAAASRGIDPNIALAVAKSEGLNGYVGDNNSSFGPYQLHYGGVAKGGNAVGGLGDVFTKRTGLDARDPSTWRQQVDFALEEAKRGGWGPWHGWKGESRAGLLNNGATPSAQPSPATPSPPPFTTLPTPASPVAPATPSPEEPVEDVGPTPQYDTAAMRGLLARLFQEEAPDMPQTAPEPSAPAAAPMKRGRGIAFKQLTIATPKFTRQA